MQTLSNDWADRKTTVEWPRNLLFLENRVQWKDYADRYHLEYALWAAVGENNIREQNPPEVFLEAPFRNTAQLRLRDNNRLSTRIHIVVQS